MTAKAEELWEKYDAVLGREGNVPYSAFIAALKEYGAAVRARDAEVCMELTVSNLNPPGGQCAAAISREPLP